jgi:hypothetical protein
VIPESHDVNAVTLDAGASGYAYVARRSYGVIALAEARGMDRAVATKFIDRLADELDACGAHLSHEGRLVDGAARIVAQIDRDGSLQGLNVKAAPGGPIAANLLMCVIAPMKRIGFPLATDDGGARGIAIETEWGPAHGAVARDGGP